MRLGSMIGILLVAILLGTPTWGSPENWAVWVPTHARYTHSASGSFGTYYGAPYDLTGIDHVPWYVCWWGHLCTDDQTAFGYYEVRGSYYDCEGNLLEENAIYWGTQWTVLRGTGTIFGGGIGGQGTSPACYGTKPASDCRLYVSMAPVKRPNWSCDSWPSVPTSGASAGKNLGRPPESNCDVLIGNPINVATGNKYEETTDITVSTPGIPLEFKRSYNSQSTYDGPLGYGWTHFYNIRLEDITLDTETARRVVIWDGDGRGLYFTEMRKEADFPDEIRFSGESGVKDRLKQMEGTGDYLLSRKEGNLTYQFDPEGNLTAISDLNGNQVTLSYETGRLSQVSNNFGKTLIFHYDADGRIDWVKDPKEQILYYSYDEGNLFLVNYPDGNSVIYGYSNHDLTDKYDTESNLIGHWDYDDKHKATAYYSHMTEGIEHERIDLQYAFLETEVLHSSGFTTYTIEIKDGVYLVKEIEGCTNCGSVNKRLEYSDRLDLVSITSIDGKKEITTQYVYDNPKIPWEQRGLIEQKTEALGSELERTTHYSYTYDDLNPLLVREKVEKRQSVVSVGGEKTTRWTYDGSGNLVFKKETGYVLSDGVPVQKTYTTGYGYTDLGQIEWIDGPRTDVSDRTTFQYYPNTPEEGHSRGQLKAMVNALNHRIEFSEYDGNGNVGKITDPNGVVTAYTYDDRNRVITVTNTSTGGVIQYLYDSHGNVVSVVLPEGNRIDYAYDPGDRLEEIKDSLGNTIHYEYDTEGNRVRQEISDPDGVLQEYLDFDYDSFNRLKKIINPDSTFTEYDYDGNGNRISTKDPNGHITTYSYNELNRLFQVTQPGTILTSYGYDAHDNLTFVTDGNANKTDYSYDDFGRLAQTISPDTGTTTYSYDESANLVQKTDARGTVITYTYDPLNRLTRVDFPRDTDILYTYDDPLASHGIGRLTGMTDSSGSSTFHYDSLGNIIREEKIIQEVLYATAYRYDLAGGLSGLTYPSGISIDYEFDKARQIKGVNTKQWWMTKTLAENIRYRPFGPLTEFTYGNGISLSEDYDLRYQLGSLKAGIILDFEYIRDGLGNIETITDHLDTTRTQVFGYDDLDRLTGAQGIYGTLGYGYDPVGNRLIKTLGEETDAYLYQEGTNRLESINGANPTAFSYDPNGNTRSMGKKAFLYDENDRLIQASVDGEVVGQYTYNSMGQRTIKETTDGTTIFHYDLQGHLIAETNPDGSTLQEYIYLGDRLLALAPGGSSTLIHFHTDHLGIPIRMTDQRRRIVWRADYRPFGEAAVDEDPDGNGKTVKMNLRFPGQYFDGETGLHYNYFRDYHPGTGRYLQSDPLGQFGSLNLYLYVGVSPLNYMDPLGLTRVKQRKVRWDVVLSGGVKSVTGLGFLVGLGLAGGSTSGVGLVALASAATGAGIAFAFGTSEVIAGIQGQELPIGDTWDIFIQAFVKPEETRECITAFKDAAKLLPGLTAGRLQIPSNQIIEVAEFIKLGFSIGKSAYKIEQELINAGLLVPIPEPDAGYNPDRADFPYYPYP